MFTKTIYKVIDARTDQFAAKLAEAYRDGWKPSVRPVAYELCNGSYTERWMIATVERVTT